MIKSILFVLPAWIVVGLLRLNTPSFIGDDAFMTFRVIKNILNGDGFIYNPGEYIYVTTTVLWASLLAGLCYLFNEMPDKVFVGVNLFLDLVNCYLVFLIASRNHKNNWLGLISSMMFSMSWHLHLSSMIGMESSFVTCLTCVTALASREKKLWVIGIFASVACLATRPEGLFLIGAFLLSIWITEKSFPLKEVIVASVLSAMFFISVYFYFGTIIPNAAIAKSLGYHREPFQSFFALADHLISTVWSKSLHFSRAYYFLFLIISFLIWIFGALKVAKDDPTIMVLTIFNFFVIVFYFFANPLIFEWYVVPLLISYVVSIPVGVNIIVLKISSKLSTRTNITEERLYYSMSTLLFGIFLIFGLNRFDLSNFSIPLVEKNGGYRNWPSLEGKFRDSNPSLMPALGPYERENLYIELAKQIEDDINEESLVMAPEFGAFGYYSNAKIISSIGHNNPEMFQFLPAPREQIGNAINNGITLDMVNHFKPDYIFSLETFIRNTLLKSDEFKKEYKIIAIKRSGVFGSRGLYFFKKRSLG